MSPDGNPLVGWAEAPEGFLLAVGLCGQGFMLGPGLGELIAHLVLRQVAPKDMEILEKLSPYRLFVGTEKLK